MGSVTFTKTYSITGIGSTTVNVKINYSESYSASTNKTTVSLSSIQQAASRNFGSPVVRGAVQFNGTTVVSYPDNSSAYYVSLSSGSTSTYKSWTSKSSSTIQVTHGTDGKANLTIKLLSTNGSSYFGAWYQNKAVGVSANSSKTISLTTHTYSLSVNPNGGTWNGSSSAQNFNQAPTSTKTIANPTKTGYTFTGWSLSGGGSFSGTTYTFGESNGTLTAQWSAASYTVSLTAGDYIASVSGGGSKEYGSSVTVTAALGSATGYTYVFDGWYDGNTKVSSSLSYTFTMPASAVSLTAVGTRSINSYTLSFDANGGEGAPEAITRTYGVTITLPATVPTMTGYHFLGWSTNNSATTPDYLPESSYTITENSILYAVWEEASAGSVHIDNGTSFDVYAIYIDNGTSWDQYVPYIDNGTSWDIYS